jgi:hypothetical protein
MRERLRQRAQDRVDDPLARLDVSSRDRVPGTGIEEAPLRHVDLDRIQEPVVRRQVVGGERTDRVQDRAPDDRRIRVQVPAGTVVPPKSKRADSP